jgi:hypothetical protein
LATLQRIEQNDGVVKGNFSTILKIQKALEQAGIGFTDGDAGKSASVCRWTSLYEDRLNSTTFFTNCNTAGNIFTAVDLPWKQRLWLRQFEATQGRRDYCW